MVIGTNENTASSDAEMMPEPLMAIPRDVVPSAVQLQLRLQFQMQMQLQQLSGGQQTEGQQTGVVGGDDTLLSLDEAFHGLNETVDGDIDLESILHSAPAPPVDSSTSRIISPVLDPPPVIIRSSIHPFIHPFIHSRHFHFQIPFCFYTHIASGFEKVDGYSGCFEF